eukprot:gnl/TRDRNA2_/TRDRNA2_88141_c0_seq1.p1 gnl/TRDRNA2_/TRDRNA2_88141_c0~~gnl/TRDRNA2_/TRDRNA2_88141_c0_seq1.p1  ORF type:complete len:387 (+),score=54.26 gnl/TRDRNA2_/TRDRNA2_88141_c0_seq1:64-1161(+)
MGHSRPRGFLHSAVRGGLLPSVFSAAAWPANAADQGDAEPGGSADFDFSWNGCARHIRHMDWNANVSDSEWRQMYTRAVNCVRHRDRLTRADPISRSSALSGIHTPTTLVPTIIEEMPEVPPLYWVLPVWDMVVSNQVRLFGAYDTQELDVLMRMTLPGDTFVDIGANVGAVTVPMAAHVGSKGWVYSFEPFRQVFQYLNANVAANGLANVHAFHCALSDPTAEPTVIVPAPSMTLGQNVGMYGVFKGESLDPNEPVPGAREHLEEISVRTLDSFSLPKADVVKIDVEGHAPRVLAGAVETLQKHRPVLWFETNSDTTPDTLLRPELNYHCKLLKETTEDTFLCIPLEKYNEVWGRAHQFQKPDS